MNAAQRRERILTRLNSAGAPLSASTLAAELGAVSYTHLTLPTTERV